MAQGTFLFLGDNLIAGYNWQKRMPLFEVHSHGFPNAVVEGLLEKLPEIVQEAPAPHIILIMMGINNVIAEDYTFVDQIRRIIIRLSNNYPEAEIIVNSLPNVKVPFLVDDAIYHLNNNLRTMASQTGCCYLDNFAVLAQEATDIFKEDGIQLTSQTYDMWARSILEYVAFLYEDD